MAAIVSSPVSIVNATGLHARPAANVVNVAKQYQSDIKLVFKAIEANAKSVVSVMGLDVSLGDKIQIKADGPDAQAAITALTQVISSGCGEK
ncbi:HPr family phosphocarrier protein [Chitinibacter bivalviorum]|uniref:Phosphocarrier protein HPr n=1 Tax=Chitinibacter bivalviorum TaxID=2739434 RepID=A0A7H9BKV9_9NEIS|nr:HPr family phosphocarrier protein [Chitinibacter bivalviorum]QLG89213.1 HPr family phosphocarrier protein [Chitinibacter bivalviorum]